MAHQDVTDADVAALAEAMVRSGRVRVARLGNNVLGPEGLAYLADAVPRCPALRELSLRAANLGESGGLDAIAPALGRCTALEALDLEENDLDPGHMALVAAALPRTLRTLRLATNGIGSDDEGPAALAAALAARCPQLAALDVRSNFLRATGLARLLDPLAAACRSLRDLHLGDNNLDADGTACLVRVLPMLRASLRLLDVSGNRLTPPLLTELAQALPPDLESLYVSTNQLEGGAGAEALAAVLGHCPRLSELHAGWNALGPHGLLRLAQAVAGTALRTLHVFSTQADGPSLLALLLHGGICKLGHDFQSVPRPDRPEVARLLARNQCTQQRRATLLAIVVASARRRHTMPKLHTSIWRAVSDFLLEHRP